MFQSAGLAGQRISTPPVSISVVDRRVARIWKRGGLFWKSEKCANDLDSNFHWPWISFTRFVRNLEWTVSEKSETQSFFRPNLGDLRKKKKKKKKKKVFAKSQSDFSAEIQNSNVFSAQKQVISKKKKKVFAKIQSDFSAEIQHTNVFSAQKQVISKKKRSSPKFRVIFRPKSRIQTFFPPKSKWSPKKKKKKKKKKVFAKIPGDFSSDFASSNVWGGALFVWGGLFSIFHRKSASKAQKTCDFAYFTSQWGGLEPPPPPPGYATGCRKRKPLHLLKLFVNGSITWLAAILRWSLIKNLCRVKCLSMSTDKKI